MYDILDNVWSLSQQHPSTDSPRSFTRTGVARGNIAVERLKGASDRHRCCIVVARGNIAVERLKDIIAILQINAAEVARGNIAVERLKDQLMVR